MSIQSNVPPRNPPVSGWASGGLVFAAAMLIIVGLFEIVAGFVAIVDDEFYVLARNYTFDLDVSTWGWIHLLLGIVLVSTGFGLAGGKGWAAVVAVVIAGLSAVANFLFIPYYPIWSLLVIGIDLWIIWSVTRPGVLRD
jgi:hypothetical protein